MLLIMDCTSSIYIGLFSCLFMCEFLPVCVFQVISLFHSYNFVGIKLFTLFADYFLIPMESTVMSHLCYISNLCLTPFLHIYSESQKKKFKHFPTLIEFTFLNLSESLCHFFQYNYCLFLKINKTYLNK